MEDLRTAGTGEEPVTLRRRRPRRRSRPAQGPTYVVPKKNSIHFRDTDGNISSASTATKTNSPKRKRNISEPCDDIPLETASDDGLTFYR